MTSRIDTLAKDRDFLMNVVTIQPRLSHVQCLRPGQLLKLAYWEWGDPGNPRVLLCLHGLTRQGRDFDTLARSLCNRYRVVCPDMLGRGYSDDLLDPAGYQVPAYGTDVVTLLARLNAELLHVVGTSMGGLIALLLAALPQTPIERLVLNDVGPELPLAALQRIGAYVGAPLYWDNEQAAFDDLRRVSPGFGPHTDEQWAALSRPMLRPEGAGFKLHYDPRIGEVFRGVNPESAAANNAFLWKAYDAIRCPTLVLHGAESDLLTSATAQAMTQRGPRAQRYDIDGVGHAPTLVQDEQVAVVQSFLMA
jgi:pimeloyl-ACP methyl ester carboxylesterase